jgi:glucose-1-phosphate cytidylyltransferase
VEVHHQTAEPWRVTRVDADDTTQTGGRIKCVLPYLRSDPYFALTYGDGVANIDIVAEVRFHVAHRKKATVTAVRPAKSFGAIDGDRVLAFDA